MQIDILAELTNTNDNAVARRKIAVEIMHQAFNQAMIEDYEPLIVLGRDLPDPYDAHVLAAAIKAEAEMIVTENLKDFPNEYLNKFNLEAKNADEFIADTIELDKGRALTAISNMRQRFSRPELNPKNY